MALVLEDCQLQILLGAPLALKLNEHPTAAGARVASIGAWEVAALGGATVLRNDSGCVSVFSALEDRDVALVQVAASTA
jgi:hypothetical protein